MKVQFHRRQYLSHAVVQVVRQSFPLLLLGSEGSLQQLQLLFGLPLALLLLMAQHPPLVEQHQQQYKPRQQHHEGGAYH